MSLVEKDDIREYDPRLWEKLKAKNLIIREKAEQRAQRVKVTADKKKYVKEYRQENKEQYNAYQRQYRQKKNEKRKEQYEKQKLSAREKAKKHYHEGRGKQWYHENKERLKELRKNRIVTKESKANDYLYKLSYYEKNRDLINAKRREKARILRESKQKNIE